MNFDRLPELKVLPFRRSNLIISVSSKMLHQEVRENPLRSGRSQGKQSQKKVATLCNLTAFCDVGKETLRTPVFPDWTLLYQAIMTSYHDCNKELNVFGRSILISDQKPIIFLAYGYSPP